MKLAGLPLTLPEDEVLRLLGYPAGKVPSAPIRERLGNVLDEARRLASARGVWKVLPPFVAESIGLEPVDAERLVVGLATVGGAIESRAGDTLREGDSLGALILDAAGSVAVEETADRVCEDAVRMLSEEGGAWAASHGRIARLGGTGELVLAAPHVGCRISPGYGRWQLKSQAALFDLLPADELGVQLLPSYLMSPRKSVSFAMWLGAGAAPVTGLSGCARCELPICRYRRREVAPGAGAAAREGGAGE